MVDSSIMTSFSFNLLTITLWILAIFSSTINSAGIPANKTFKFVNFGEIPDINVEYIADYRPFNGHKCISTSPFQFGFYNTTPNAFTLAMKIGVPRSESIRRWVWEANRGKPVKENATFSFGRDGNLLLAEADGEVVWQSGTANKGVVDCELLPNGNLVLLDSKGMFVWQSFDFPTDTLLLGQSLRGGGVNKLVSRASVKDNSNGPYSMVLEPNKGFSWFYKSPNSPTPMLYFSSSFYEFGVSAKESEKFDINTETDAADVMILRSYLGLGRSMAMPNYNATFSFLRLGMDGRLRIFTYNDLVDSSAWEVVFTQFINDRWYREVGQECFLPEKCGKFGLCSKDQCVACPTEKGLMGWSEECELKNVSSCKPGDFHYYKVEGVEHFVAQFTRGSSATESDCEKKCSGDCKCLGYFYYRERSRCWNVFDIKTLRKVANSSHVGFIKVSNK